MSKVINVKYKFFGYVDFMYGYFDVYVYVFQKQRGNYNFVD